MKELLEPTATNDVLFALINSPLGLLGAWLVLINVAAFFVYGLDKRKAKCPGARRIPERNLLLAAVMGGSLGALLGMQVFHHKTRHRVFAVGVPVILATQLALGVIVYLVK